MKSCNSTQKQPHTIGLPIESSALIDSNFLSPHYSSILIRNKNIKIIHELERDQAILCLSLINRGIKFQEALEIVVDRKTILKLNAIRR